MRSGVERHVFQRVDGEETLNSVRSEVRSTIPASSEALKVVMEIRASRGEDFRDVVESAPSVMVVPGGDPGNMCAGVAFPAIDAWCQHPNHMEPRFAKNCLMQWSLT